MEAGDREAIQRFWLRGLAQKVDCRKDLRLDQSQSPSGSRLRALRHDRRRLRPPRHDPHHAQAACCCKRLVMNPNFPDGLLDAAAILEDLRNPPGNRLEVLKGSRNDQMSIRINDQWRICFQWVDHDAWDVEIVDYH